MDKRSSEDVLKDFNEALVGLTRDFLLKGRFEEDELEINLNAPNLKDELIFYEKAKVKNYEKYLENASVVNKCLLFPEREGVFIVKEGSLVDVFFQILINGVFVLEEHQKRIGISIDYSKSSKWNKKHIALQSAAQVIGYNKKQFNITHIRKEMINDNKLFDLLGLKDSKSISNNFEEIISEEKTSNGIAKSLDKVIGMINPTPEKQKRGRPKNTIVMLLDNIVLIPGIVNPKTSQINFQKLFFAIGYLSKVLALRGRSYEEIIENSIIKIYKDLLPFTFGETVNFCVRKALDFNCRLFDF
jgi:hypothetical protein